MIPRSTEYYPPGDSLAMDLLATRLRMQHWTKCFRVIEKEVSFCGRYWRNKVTVYESHKQGMD